MNPTLSGKTLVIATTVTIVILVALAFQPFFWTHKYAKSQALQIIQSSCLRDSRDPELLSKIRDIGSHPWSFEAIYEGNPRYLYGCSISDSGQIEVYGGDPDDPQSAAYEPPK